MITTELHTTNFDKQASVEDFELQKNVMQDKFRLFNESFNKNIILRKNHYNTILKDGNKHSKLINELCKEALVVIEEYINKYHTLKFDGLSVEKYGDNLLDLEKSLVAALKSHDMLL